jgi:hypothetical protein
LVARIAEIDADPEQVEYQLEDETGRVAAYYDLDDREARSVALGLSTGMWVRVFAKPRVASPGANLCVLNVAPLVDDNEIRYHLLICKLCELRFVAGLEPGRPAAGLKPGRPAAGLEPEPSVAGLEPGPPDRPVPPADFMPQQF